MPWAAAAAAVVGIGGAAAQADSARSASNAQKDATKAATEEQRRQFDISRMDTAPWRVAGGSALKAQSALLGLDQPRGGPSTLYTGSTPLSRAEFDAEAYLNANPDVAVNPNNAADPYAHYINEGARAGGYRPAYKITPATPEQIAAAGPQNSPLLRKFTMDDFKNDPVSKASFEFGLSEGEKAVQRMFGSRGLQRSGAAVKAATRFASDYTGTKAGESRDRFVQDQTNLYNRLAGVSGTGQTTATNNASNAMTLGSNNAQLLVGEGNARGAAAIAQGNAWGGAANNTANSLNSAYWLNRAYPQRTTTTTSQPSYTMNDNQMYTGFE